MSIYKNGTRYWVDFRWNRIRYRRPSPDNTLKGARAYEILLRSKLAKGESIDRPGGEKGLIAFSDFSEIFIEDYARVNNKASEVKNKRSALSFHLIPFFGKMPLNQIENKDIDDFKTAKQKSGLSGKSTNNLLVVLSKCLNIALDWQYLERIPKIKHLKVQRPAFDYLTEPELQKLLDSTQGQIRDMILMVSKTGLRFGELIALEWGSVDLNDRLQLTIDKSIVRDISGSTKGYKVRHIPLVNDVYEMLSGKKRDSGFVFNNNGHYMVQSTCIKLLHETCQKAGLRKIGWHCLRHTFASHLAMRGITMIALQQLLGHRNISTTMIYAHLSPQSLNESIKLLESPKAVAPTHIIPIESGIAIIS